MVISLRLRVAVAAVLFATTAAVAQTGSGANGRGTTPGSGLVSIDLSGPSSSVPVASGLQTPQPAECLGRTDGPWALVAPYGWIFGMKGAVGAGQRTAQVDLSVRDSIDKLGDLKGAAQLHIESGYGSVGVIADLTYLRVEPLNNLITVDSRGTLLELMGMYRVLDTGGRQAGAVTFDVLAGGRYYRFSSDITGNLLGLLAAERTNKWIDLVVGARTGVQVTDDLGMFARGDVGGFGIGHSSKQACNVVVGFEYQCCDCASLAGGYRWLKIDREAGVGRDRFLLDATLAGPFVAFTLRY
jgi:hypothetical protein